MRSGCQEGNSLHDLTGLAISALRDVQLHPGLLNRMESVCPKVFNGANLATRCRAHRRNTRPDRFAVLMNRASAAESHATAKLRSRQSQNVPYVPEQGHAGIAIERAIYPIHLELHHQDHPFALSVKHSTCHIK